MNKLTLVIVVSLAATLLCFILTSILPFVVGTTLEQAWDITKPIFIACVSLTLFSLFWSVRKFFGKNHK